MSRRSARKFRRTSNVFVPEPPRAIRGILSLSMRHRRYRSITFFLALLLVVSSWVPMTGLAEAQMRCAGSTAQAPPCVQAQIPTTGLPDQQVYDTLMSCCRAMRSGCALMRDYPMRHSASDRTVSHHALLSARRCLVSLHVAAPVPTPPVVRRARWLLTTTPTCAPPAAVPATALSATSTRHTFWIDVITLSPHVAPRLHGLRAPPAA